VSDDLRTRIAEIIADHRFDDSTDGEVFCHESGNSPMVGIKRGSTPQDDWQEYADHLADALIGELGLRREVESYAMPDSSRYRYVTEWSADD
jgi:hypothetical protein